MGWPAPGRMARDGKAHGSAPLDGLGLGLAFYRYRWMSDGNTRAKAEGAKASRTGADVLRVILIRHGRPSLPVSPRTGHRGFRDYIDDYERAGVDPQDLPPEQLRNLVREISAVFTSDRQRAHESAR